MLQEPFSFNNKALILKASGPVLWGILFGLAGWPNDYWGLCLIPAVISCLIGGKIKSTALNITVVSLGFFIPKVILDYWWLVYLAIGQTDLIHNSLLWLLLLCLASSNALLAIIILHASGKIKWV